MELYILVFAFIIIACLAFSKLSKKSGLPTLIIFISLGLLFGSDGIFKIQFENYKLVKELSSIALIFIIFYGGFNTNWKMAKPVVKQSVLLSTLGVVFTALFVGAFCEYVLNMDRLLSYAIGAAISSTDAASVFAILKQRKLNLKYNTASLLELESGSNDPFAYLITILILNIAQYSTFKLFDIVKLLGLQLIFGCILGVVFAYLTKYILNHVEFISDGFDTIFVFAMVLIAYVLPLYVQGNGYLSVYLMGLLLGNQMLPNKKILVNFFDGITALMQMLTFFMIGLLATPSTLGSVLYSSFFIFLFLTFLARPMIVWLLIHRFQLHWNQMFIISLAGLKGASSIVFAIMIAVSTTFNNQFLFNIVFLIVLYSILIQGMILPYASKRYYMLDDSSDVLKTFNDYVEELPVQSIPIKIKENHSWKNKLVKDIILPMDTLLVSVNRNNEQITPDGNFKIEVNDIVILVTKVVTNTKPIHLEEVIIDKEHRWVHKTLSEISFKKNQLVIFIIRDDKLVIPNGKTMIMEDDIVIMKD